MSPRYKNLLLLHITVLIFGFTGILGKLISIAAEPLVFWRCFLAAVMLGLFLVVIKRLKSYPAKVLMRWSAIGLVVAAHWITFFAAIKLSTVSVALATLASSSLFVSLFAPLVTSQKFDWRESALGLVVIFGIGIIFSVETEHTLGIVVALISAFLAGVFSTFNSLEIKKYDAYNISFYELGAASLVVFIYMLFTGDVGTELVMMSAADWAWLLLLASVATAFAYVAATEVMKELTPFTVALAINMEPVYSILLALLIFKDDEKMSPGFYWGAFIVLAALFTDAIIKRQARRRARSKALG